MANRGTVRTSDQYVDVSVLAAEFGFAYNVMLTQDLHLRLLPDPFEKLKGETYVRRLGEVLFLAYEVIQSGSLNGNRIVFQVYLKERIGLGRWQTSRLDLWCCRQGKGYVIGMPDDFWL